MDDFEWVDALEDTPLVKKGFLHVSVNVRVKMQNGTIRTGFYDYSERCWYTETKRGWRKEPDSNPVICWQSL